MAIRPHCSIELVSKWQWVVVKVASYPRLDLDTKLTSEHLAAAPLKFDEPMIAAAEAVGKAAFEQQSGASALPVSQAAVAANVSVAAGGAQQCAAAAFELAKARIEGDSAAAARAGAHLWNTGPVARRR